VSKARPYLEMKVEGDCSMDRKRSAGGTLSQDDAQARPYKVSPTLGRTSGDLLKMTNRRFMVLLPLPGITMIKRSSSLTFLSGRLERIERTAERRTYVWTRKRSELRDRLHVERRMATESSYYLKRKHRCFFFEGRSNPRRRARAHR
jgi:hypothetical protein